MQNYYYIMVALKCIVLKGLYSLSKELVACTVSLYKFGRKCNILSRMSLDIQFNVVLWMDDLI